MPTTLPRILVTVDPPMRDALEFLVQRYGLSKAAMIRLAVRRMAEAEGWDISAVSARGEQGKAAA
jgi:hypothetical protein